VPPQASGLVDRALRVVGDVRAREGPRALALATTVLTLLAAYYLLKVARESLLLSRYDAETKTYLAALQGLLLVPGRRAFGWRQHGVGPLRPFTRPTGLLAAHLAIFALLHALGVSIGLAFFVWVGVFNVFVIAQFWTFASDVYDEPTGRRLFAVVGLGSSVGAILGAYGAGLIGHLVGTTGLLLVAITLLLSTLIGFRWVHVRSGVPDAERAAQDQRRGAVATSSPARSGLSLLFADRFLLAIAVLMLLANLENTLGELILDRVLLDRVHAEVAALGGGVAEIESRVRDFKSLYFGSINTLGLVLQLFVVGRLLAWGGAARAILVLPLVALVGQLGMAGAGAALAAVTVAKVAENATDYSVQNTARNALFLVASREAKYRVKVLVDSVAVRLGDAIAGGAVLLASTVALPTLAFVAGNLVVTAIWLVIAVRIGRAHDRRLSPEAVAGDTMTDSLASSPAAT